MTSEHRTANQQLLLECAEAFEENCEHEGRLASFVALAQRCRAAAQAESDNRTSNELYYLQARGHTGNSLLWWREGRHGYTNDIRKAHVFTKDEAFAQHRCRPDTDFPWRKDYIDSRVQLHVVSDDIDHEEEREFVRPPDEPSEVRHGPCPCCGTEWTPNVAPIARVAIVGGEVSQTEIYAPGLPDGDHDLFPVPLERASQPPDDAQYRRDLRIAFDNWMATNNAHVLAEVAMLINAICGPFVRSSETKDATP